MRVRKKKQENKKMENMI